MNNLSVITIPSVERATVLMGGYACAETTFAGRERTAKHLPGTQVWSPPT